MEDQQQKAKRMAARAALDEIDGVKRLGLGSGSTLFAFVRELGKRPELVSRLVVAVGSEQTREIAQASGLSVLPDAQIADLDLAVDGADEVDPDGHLIKGGGGALLREKLIVKAARRFLVIVDESKEVTHLGAFGLPLEVMPFAAPATLAQVESVLLGFGLKGKIIPRKINGQAVLSDNGHLLFDAKVGPITAPKSLSEALDGVAGLVAHGLFTNLTNAVIVAGAQGIRKVVPGRAKTNDRSDAINYAYLREPEAIYRESFARVRNEAILCGLADDVKPIAVRIAHAAGDPEITRNITASDSFTACAHKALLDGSPILCDTFMLKAGVTRAFLKADPLVLCGLDGPDVADKARAQGTTRSAVALQFLLDQHPEAIVAIGNAPTALFHLLEQIAQGKARPRAVIAMPVGFVGARESKEALVALAASRNSKAPLPYLTLRGRRGGAGMTAAALNAIACLP